jgi:hypothetical protein
MLASRNEWYVPQEHRVLIILSVGEDSAKQLLWLDGIAREPLAVSASDPSGRIAKTFSIWVVAGRRDESPYGLLKVKCVRRDRRPSDLQLFEIDRIDAALDKLHGHLPFRQFTVG